MPLTIRRLRATDIPKVLAIQSQSPEAAQWPQQTYRALKQAGEIAWVAEKQGRIGGFLVARRIADEMEILNLAILPELRRKGIAAKLLAASREWARAEGATRLYLEVRSTNQRARRFYESQGFHVMGTRPNYYRDPTDDAVLLTAAIVGS